MRPAAPALRAMPPAPFADDAAHLQAALAALDAVLRARVDRVRASLGGDPWLRGLNVDDATVDALLDRSPLSAPWPAGEVQPAIEAALAGIADDLAAREAATLAAGRALRLLDLRARFGLDDLAAEVVLLALAPELDDRYARLIGWLHDDLARNRPSVGLCLDLFGGPLPGRLQARRAFAPDAPLLTSGLVTLGEANHWRDRPVKLALGLVRWLLGEAPVDPSTGARVVRLPVDEVGDADSLESYGDRLVKSIRAGARHAVNVS
ncbi:MAG: hypothetical protein KC620_09085, partial [Myxococcales bacterium]|nr:hypothetical protein [Myxococcales bacterium]